jgi:FKBP-type peptidyl-prolyl cis-trans isomerase
LNKAPVIEKISEITVNEGETITLAPKVTDPEGKKVTVTYSGWMTESTYKTKYSDAGKYKVKITASDQEKSSSVDVSIVVIDLNRAPILEDIKDIAVIEGEKINVEAVAADPDNQPVTITYSQPFSNTGEWQTKVGDAGKYTITVTATDGKANTQKQFVATINAKNKAPVMQTIEDMTIQLAAPGDSKTIALKPTATDPDGDKVTITYSGWMTSATKTVKWGEEGGSHEVTITASDGVNKVSQTITIEINSAPCLKGITPGCV